MRKLLVVSDPPVAPGYLPRLRYLCDYLVRKGYDVTLLTEQAEPLRFEHTYPIIALPMYSGGTLDWFVKTVWTLFTDWHNRAFAKKYLTAQRSMQYYVLHLATSRSVPPNVLHVRSMCPCSATYATWTNKSSTRAISIATSHAG